jgi:hypothetical protein
MIVSRHHIRHTSAGLRSESKTKERGFGVPDLKVNGTGLRGVDEGLALPHLWCVGFPAGMLSRKDSWRPLLDLNRIDHGLMLPILF